MAWAGLVDLIGFLEIKQDMSVKPDSIIQSTATLRRRTGVAQVSANLAGAALCSIYFTFLDLAEAIPQADEILIVSSILTLCLIILGTIWSLRWQKDTIQFFRSLRQGQTPSDQLRARTQRKVINSPYFGAALSMAIWMLAAIIMTAFRFTLPIMNEAGASAIYGAFRVFVGVVVAGVASSSIVFFSFEAIYRPLLLLVFPEGGLVNLRGVLRLRLRHRLLFSYFLVGVAPICVVGLIFFHKASSLAQSQGSILTNIIYVIVFVVLTSIGLAIILSRLVSESVVKPVQVMQKVTSLVKKGDLNTTIPVTSNDELGSLGESFNLMLDGMRERRLLKETFGKYVSQQVRDEILAGRINLDGESKEVTLLFTDLRDFTPMVEATPPKTVVKIINDYFQEMAQAVKSQEGLVVQFIGDEIEAVFGAPLSLDNHAERAVNAALDMRRRLQGLNRKFEARGLKPLRHGIGIHTGTVLAGNIGSSDRLSYALVGDAVNLASRIQDLNKQFGTDILISAQTREALRELPDLEKMPEVMVKGKRRPVEVYSVL
jgi:adenylate cyclase